MSLNVGTISARFGLDPAEFLEKLRGVSGATALFSNEMKRQMKETSREGAESFRLLEETLGLRISRPLTRLLTQEFPAFAKGLQAVLGGAVVGALGAAGFEAFERISKAIEKAQKAEEELQNSTRKSGEIFTGAMQSYEKAAKARSLDGLDRKIFEIDSSSIEEGRRKIDELAGSLQKTAKDAAEAHKWTTELLAGIGNAAHVLFNSQSTLGMEDTEKRFVEFQRTFDRISALDALHQTHDSAKFVAEQIAAAEKSLALMTAMKLTPMQSVERGVNNVLPQLGLGMQLGFTADEIGSQQTFLDNLKKINDLLLAGGKDQTGRENEARKADAAERQVKAQEAIAALYKEMGSSLAKLQPETDPLKKLDAEIAGFRSTAEADFRAIGRSAASALALNAAHAALDSYEKKLDALKTKMEGDIFAKEVSELASKPIPGIGRETATAGFQLNAPPQLTLPGVEEPKITAAAAPAAAQTFSVPPPATPRVTALGASPITIPAPAAPVVNALTAAPVTVPAASAPQITAAPAAPLTVPPPATPRVTALAGSPINVPAPAPIVSALSAAPIAIPAPEAPQISAAPAAPFTVPPPATPRVTALGAGPITIPAPVAPIVNALSAAPVTIPAPGAPAITALSAPAINIPAPAPPQVTAAPPVPVSIPAAVAPFPTLGAGGLGGAQFDAFAKDQGAQLKLAASAYEDAMGPQDKYKLGEERLDLLLQKGLIDTRAYTAAMAELIDLRSRSAKKGLEGSVDELNASGGHMQQLQQRMVALRGMQSSRTGLDDEPLNSNDLAAVKLEMQAITDEEDKILLKTGGINAGIKAWGDELQRVKSAGEVTFEMLSQAQSGFEENVAKSFTAIFEIQRGKQQSLINELRKMWSSYFTGLAQMGMKNAISQLMAPVGKAISGGGQKPGDAATKPTGVASVLGAFIAPKASGAAGGATGASSLTSAGASLHEAGIALLSAAQALKLSGAGAAGGAGPFASAGGGASAGGAESASSDMPFFAEGGDATPGSSFVSGEAGAEKVDLDRSGNAHVTPLGFSMDKGGGDTHQNFDMRGAVVTDDLMRRAEAARMMGASEERSYQRALTGGREAGLRKRN
jgi:hypothetical protein